MRDLTPTENQVLGLLGDAWSKFIALPAAHPSDAREMKHAIHAAQNIVLARPATEAKQAKRQRQEPDHEVDRTTP